MRGVQLLVVVVALLTTTPAPTAAVINSVITQWLTIAQNTVISVQVEHQQAARLYGIVATGESDGAGGATNTV